MTTLLSNPQKFEFRAPTAAVPAATFDIAIGQQIQCIGISPHHIEVIRWDIENITHVIADYAPTLANGRVTPVTGYDLLNNPIVFCWWQGGTYDVTCTMGTKGFPTVRVTHKFRVAAPQVPAPNCFSGVVGVGNYKQKRFIRYVHDIQRFDIDGFSTMGDVTGSAGFAGQLAAIQLINIQRYKTDTNTYRYCSSLNGQWVLDAGARITVFYQDTYAVARGTRVDFEYTDGPGLELGGTMQTAQIGRYGGETVPESFKMFLMFLSEAPASVWVPVKMLSWGWAGKTRLSAGVWQPTTDTVVPRPEDSDPDGFPEWGTNTTADRWDRC